MSLLASLILASGTIFPLQEKTWNAEPSDDVWVYPHSSSPGAEEVMRIWGDGTRAIDSANQNDGGFGYGFLKFKLDNLPQGKVKSAKLIVFAQGNASLTAEVMKSMPLEVFRLKGDLNEKTFASGGTEVMPIGSGLGTPTAEKVEAGWKLTFDLLAKIQVPGRSVTLTSESFWGEATLKQTSVGIALASKISPADSRDYIYRVWTKEGPKGQRPMLRLTFE